MAKLVHLRDDCIGCNSCVEHCPAYWFIDDDGKARLRASVEKRGAWIRPLEALFERENRAAATDCPVNIIKVEG
jgi:ferredoxin